MKKIGKIGKLVIEIAIFAAGALLVFCIAYYFGSPLLTGWTGWGNDFPFAQTYITYLANHFPPIPTWMNIWAGGTPFLADYPPLPTIITFFTHTLSGLSITQAMRLLFFLSVPVAAIGLVVLARVLTKNWWLSILAGIIMLLSPDTWIWITNGGFYAISFSVPFLVWSLAIISYALTKNSPIWKGLAMVSYAIVWLAHPMAGTFATLAIPFIGIVIAKQKKQSIWKGIISVFPILAAGGLLAFSWLIRFYIIRQNQGIGQSADNMFFENFKEILGLTLSKDKVYNIATFYTASMLILFCVGTLAAIIRKSPLIWFVLLCLLAIFVMTAPGYAYGLVKIFITFWSATNVRSGVLIRIFGPIIAAYGAVSIVRPVFWIIEKLIKVLKENIFWKYFTETVGGVVGAIVLFYLVKNVIVIPADIKPWAGDYVGYGPIKEIQTESFKKVMDSLFSQGIKVEERVTYGYGLVDAVVKKEGLTSKDRVEVVPFNGNLSGSMNNYVNVMQIPTYSGVSYIPRMIGWQIGCMYYLDACDSSQAEDLARWFGISRVWLGGDNMVGPQTHNVTWKMDDSPLFKFEKQFLDVGGKSWEWNDYNFLDVTGIASQTNKPAILVIGDNPPNSDVYDTIFRGLSKASFGYKNAWSVKGKKYVDDYNLNELSKFDTVIIYGYKYHNYARAWDLLEKYVNGGGHLLADTGWQYMSEDWGKMQGNDIISLDMPKILPVAKTLWGNVGTSWNLNITSSTDYSGVGNVSWGTPVYINQPWGMALADKSSLKNGAEALVTNGDKVLVASWNYGKGKVVWTGFDFWGHLNMGGGSDERLFVNKIFGWLTSGNGESSEKKLDFERIKTDVIKIKVDQSSSGEKLLYKESASDNWKAKIVVNGKTTNLPIYKAGPGWRLMFLPKLTGDAEVILYYRKTFVEVFGIIVSATTAICVLLYMLGYGNGFTSKVGKNIIEKAKTKTKNFKKNWENEDDE